MSEEFRGKTVIITGGGHGIGRSVAIALGRRGLNVAIGFASDSASASQTAIDVQDAGGHATAVRVDIRDENDVARFVEAARSEYGSIDYLVNNAAVSRPPDRPELTCEEWKDSIDVNLNGTFLMTWAVKDEMISRGNGSIVNVASIAGIVPSGDLINFGTAKAAVIFLTRTCAKAFAPHGVRVNCVAPGLTFSPRVLRLSDATRTRMASSVPMGRGAQPQEIADVICFLLSNSASYVTGQTIPVCGGRT